MEKCKWANLIINILLFFIGCNIISGSITLIAIIFGSIDRKIIEVVVYIGVFLLLFIAVKKIKKVIRNIITSIKIINIVIDNTLFLFMNTFILLNIFFINLTPFLIFYNIIIYYNHSITYIN